MRHIGFQRIFLGCVKTAIHPLILPVKSFLFCAAGLLGDCIRDTDPGFSAVVSHG